jgi:RHS repeat-associated protein
MLSGNVFEANLQMVAGNNTVSVEATDVSGNLTTKNYQVNVSGSGATYSYDPNGNLVEKVEGADTWAYEWNAENQLTRVTKNSIEQARFKYDPLGRRVEKVAGSTIITTTYDAEDPFREANGLSTVTYVQGEGTDEPLAVDDGAALSYFHADGLRSVGKTTSTAGGVTLTRRYDAWGNLELGGTAGGSAFTGREHDPETGLAYYRARYYDPRTGRFMSADPLGFLADINFYRYVFNQPTLLGDPSGLRGETPMPPAGQRCANGSGGATPRPPASSCSLKKLKKRLGTVTGWKNYFCGSGPRPSPPPGAQRVQVGGFDAEGAWYVTQGDPCVDYCVCRHEQNHMKNHTKFTDLKYLECVAHQTEVNCLDKSCKGAGE